MKGDKSNSDTSVSRVDSNNINTKFTEHLMIKTKFYLKVT